MQFDSSAFLADPELFQVLEKVSTAVECPVDHVLFRQGDPPMGLYLVAKGGAMVTMHSEDGESLLSVEVLPGSLLGLPAVIGNQPYSLTARAHHGSWVGFVAKEDFNSLVQTNTTLMVKVLQVLASEVRSARIAIAQL
jgi:CRP/FNR family cyclic AMP-dependent transcriptional regulator